MMSDELTTQPAGAAPVKRGRGRPKGSRNKVSKKAQRWFQRLWEDPEFKRKFKKDWIEGKLQPQMYITGAQYAYGKPVEQVNVSSDGEQVPSAFVLIVDGKALTPGADSNNSGE
jgi:hypothetical protein